MHVKALFISAVLASTTAAVMPIEETVANIEKLTVEVFTTKTMVDKITTVGDVADFTKHSDFISAYQIVCYDTSAGQSLQDKRDISYNESDQNKLCDTWLLSTKGRDALLTSLISKFDLVDINPPDYRFQYAALIKQDQNAWQSLSYAVAEAAKTCYSSILTNDQDTYVRFERALQLYDQ